MKLLNKPWFPYVVFAFLATAIYFPSINYEYVLDDKIVFTENKYVKEGLKGIPKILGSDSFEGFFGEQKNLLPGGRYRPLSIITFAIEYQFLGANKHISHAINIALYIMCCSLLFLTLKQVFGRKKYLVRTYFFLVATVLFVIHPIHVEAVANIKGRDEIMVLIFSLLALKSSSEYFQSQKITHLCLAAVSLFLALLSKENAITYLAVIPFSLLLFSKGSRQKWLMLMSSLLVLVGIVIFLRYNALGYILNSVESDQLMNNPFIHMTISQKYATVFHTLLLYVKLGFIPHPLTHDYYPFHIQTMTWGNITPILSLVVHLGLIVAVILCFKKRKIISWSAFYYLATLSIVSNLFVNVGTFMNERFLFMSSIAFAAIAAYTVSKLVNTKNPTLKYVAVGLISILAIGYTSKSIIRVPDWENTYTLNRSAVKISKNSARANLYMGIAYFNQYKEITDFNLKNNALYSADKYISRAFELYPKYRNATQMMAGVAAEQYKQDNDLDKLLAIFFEIIKQRPDTEFIHTYLEYLNGRSEQKKGLIDFYYKVGHDELMLTQRRNEWAIRYLKYGLQINDNDKNINLALSKAYRALGHSDQADFFQNKAFM